MAIINLCDFNDMHGVRLYDIARHIYVFVFVALSAFTDSYANKESESRAKKSAMHEEMCARARFH